MTTPPSPIDKPASTTLDKPAEKPLEKTLSEGLLITRAREQYGEQSSQTSTSIRALALAVIAVSWLFLTGGHDDPSSGVNLARKEHLLLSALLAGVLALALDAAQYAITTFLWGRYIKVVESMTTTHQIMSTDNDNTWSRANRYGLIRYLLEETGENNAELRASKAKSISRAKGLLLEYIKLPYGDENIRRKVWNAFNRPQVPLYALRLNRILFWAKVYAVIAGSVLIIVFMLVRIW
jgi:hypothetical protein